MTRHRRPRGTGTECGRSSGVEHNLAKVRVVSSNLIARSKKSSRSGQTKSGFRAAFGFSGDPCPRSHPRAMPDRHETAAPRQGLLPHCRLRRYPAVHIESGDSAMQRSVRAAIVLAIATSIAMPALADQGRGHDRDKRPRKEHHAKEGRGKHHAEHRERRRESRRGRPIARCATTLSPSCIRARAKRRCMSPSG